MCLSTVYKVIGTDETPVCQYVSSVDIHGDELHFTDIMGGETVLNGSIEKIDLVNNAIIVRPVA